MEFVEAAVLGYEAAASMASGTGGAAAGDHDDPFPPTDSPVWIFGKDYSAVHERDELLNLIRSRLWFSYRRDFPEIGNSGFTSDRGWGCMLRCGQMVVAEALIRLHLGKDWRWNGDCKDEKYLSIVRLFEDHKKAVYSIHQIALLGESTDRKPVGTWFGPNTVAQVLRKLSAYDLTNHLHIHVAMDNTVIIDEIKEAAKDRSKEEEVKDWKPLLLFIPLRLGLTEVNSLYFPDLKECFEIPECVGVIGGRPNHALFFIGYVDDELIHLDPHRTQVSGQIGSKASDEEVELDRTYHIENPARLNLCYLDPSLALCFFCETESSFDNLCSRLRNRLILGHNSPLFEICRERPSHMRCYYADSEADVRPDEATGKDYGKVEASAGAEGGREFDPSDDEFEIL